MTFPPTIISVRTEARSTRRAWSNCVRSTATSIARSALTPTTKTLRALCAVSEDGRLQRLCCDQAEIKLWTEAPYRSVRIKTPAMPTFWATVGKAQAQEGSGVSWSGASRNATPADIYARLKRTGADCVSLQSLPLGSATTGVAKPPRPDRSRFLQPPNVYWMCSGPLVVTAATESPWPKQ
jgi:hypothetical protein